MISNVLEYVTSQWYGPMALLICASRDSLLSKGALRNGTFREKMAESALEKMPDKNAG